MRKRRVIYALILMVVVFMGTIFFFAFAKILSIINFRLMDAAYYRKYSSRSWRALDGFSNVFQVAQCPRARNDNDGHKRGNTKKTFIYFVFR